MTNKLGNPNNPQSRQEALMDAADEMKFAADSLYYAAQLLVFLSHGSAGKVAELADQVLQETQKLMIKN